MSNFSTPLALTQPLKCTDIGIEMPDRDLAVVHIHDAEWHLWRESGSKKAFQITPFKALDALSDVEFETLYAQKFLELQLIYALVVPEVSETQDSGQVEQDSQEPSAEADVEQSNPSPPQPAPTLKPTTTTTPSPKPLPHASPTHHKSHDANYWRELGPRIIVPVAKELFAGHPMRETSQGLRIGNNGALAVDSAKGTYFDHDEDIGGGVIQMVQRELNLDARSAFHWLQAHGYFDGTFTVSDAPYPKPKSKSRRKDSDDRGSYNYGLKLWMQSKPIPRSFNHPARQWAAHRNLLPLLLPFPAGIRYGIYDDKERGECPYIIVLACPLSAWGDAYPHLPKPEPLKTQFQALWIDLRGNPVEQKDGGDKRTYGIFGGVDDSAVLCTSNPSSDRVSVAEGVADALSIYSRRDGAVLATLGKPGGLCDKLHALESLALDGRDVTIFEDNDRSPDPKKQEKIDQHKQKVKRLGQRIISLGGSANRIRILPQYEDAAHAAQHQPFPIVNRADFDSAVSRFREKGSSEPERAAWLSLIEGGGCHE